MQLAKLSPNGDRWCAEDGLDNIVIDGAIIGEGIAPAWLDNYRVGWVRGPNVYIWNGTSVDTIWTMRSLNGFTACAGHWAAYAPNPNTILTDNNLTADGSQPALSPTGELVYVDDESFLRVFGKVGAIGSRARLPRYSERGELAWVEDRNGEFRVYPEDWALWQTDAHLAVPVTVPGESWLLVQENGRLVLHPKGSREGYIVRDVPDTYSPDAKWHAPSASVRVIWTDKAGAIQERNIRPTDARTDLRAPVKPSMDHHINLLTDDWGRTIRETEVWRVKFNLDQRDFVTVQKGADGQLTIEWRDAAGQTVDRTGQRRIVRVVA